MAEEITNTVADETPVAPVVNEENTAVDQEPQVPEQEPVDVPDENSNEEQAQDVVDEKKEDVTPQPTLEELQSKLKEYEVRDEEERMLREQLGLQDIDARSYEFMNLDQQIVNEGKQVYLRLCNEFGVDSNPDKIDASIEALKQSDPAKAYEFQRRFESLSDEVINKRNVVKQQTAFYEVNKFANDYNQILTAAPALNNILTQYVQAYAGNTSDMYGQLKEVMNIVLPAYKEAFNAGKQYALQDKAKKDTTPVSGGIATANTQSYSAGNVFTREQIAKMSTEEFAKYENVIKQQMAEGKIH